MAPSTSLPLPLPTLLSQALVAFTIEFDNEAEHRIVHWTTRADAKRPRRPKGATWLVSQAMWVNVLQYLDDSGDGSDGDQGVRSSSWPSGLGRAGSHLAA
jgi:hypothetical protein